MLIADVCAPAIGTAHDTQTKSLVHRFARFYCAVPIMPSEVTDSLLPEYFAFVKDSGSKTQNAYAQSGSATVWRKDPSRRSLSRAVHLGL